MKKIGIITFHNSYNCGSMLESYAMYKRIRQITENVEIIDFSSEGQKKLYGVFEPNNSIKNIIKNLILLPHKNQIVYNNNEYEEFKNNHFALSRKYDSGDIDDSDYEIIVAGSDQIWNITIEDFDDAYFLEFAHFCRKVAYAPSFGSKNILKYSNNPKKYGDLINDFDALSIRENNGKKWIKELCNTDVEVLIDPTLLHDSSVYDVLLDDSCTPKCDYIFYYCPGFDRTLCKFVKDISDQYNLPVICWSTKSYYRKNIRSFGFELPNYESPAVYLSLIKNAKLVLTTSYHGTIFATIYRKSFFTLKNGGMYGDDDRVITLLDQLNMMERLVIPNFDLNTDYLTKVNYSQYETKIVELRGKANKYIKENIESYYEITK